MFLPALLWLLAAGWALAITNGRQPLQRSAAAHHLYVEYDRNDSSGTFYGGGSLISSQHALTAGHMVQGFRRWTVGGGADEFQRLQWMRAERAMAHPRFGQAGPRDYDLALIWLPAAVVFTVSLQPIALPPAGIVTPFENEEGTIRGFGQTDSLRSSHSSRLQTSWTRVLDDEECAQKLGVRVPTHFCAFDVHRRSTVCNGDLGGGFTVHLEGQETLVGVGSVVLKPGSADEPSAFARVSVARDWIREVAGV